MRPPGPDDVPALFDLMQEFATSFDPPGEVETTPEKLRTALFSNPPMAEAALVWVEDKACGFAFFWPAFNSWQGVQTLYVESVYMSPTQRKGALAVDLYGYLCNVARSRGYGWVEGLIDTTDEELRASYRALGAQAEEYLHFRMNVNAEWISDLAKISDNTTP